MWMTLTGHRVAYSNRGEMVTVEPGANTQQTQVPYDLGSITGVRQ